MVGGVGRAWGESRKGARMSAEGRRSCEGWRERANGVCEQVTVEAVTLDEVTHKDALLGHDDEVVRAIVGSVGVLCNLVTLVVSAVADGCEAQVGHRRSCYATQQTARVERTGTILKGFHPL